MAQSGVFSPGRESPQKEIELDGLMDKEFAALLEPSAAGVYLRDMAQPAVPSVVLDYWRSKGVFD